MRDAVRRSRSLPARPKGPASRAGGLGSIRTWPAPRTARSRPMTVATPCSRSLGRTRQRRLEMRHFRPRSWPSGVPAGSSWSSIDTVSPGNSPGGASSKVKRLVRQLCVNCRRRAGRSLTDRCGSSAMRNFDWHPTSGSNTWPCSPVTVPEPAPFRPTRRPQPFTGGIFSKRSPGVFSAWTPVSLSSRARPADRPTLAEPGTQPRPPGGNRPRQRRPGSGALRRPSATIAMSPTAAGRSRPLRRPTCTSGYRGPSGTYDGQANLLGRIENLMQRGRHTAHFAQMNPPASRAAGSTAGASR